MQLETIYGNITRRSDTRENYWDRWERAKQNQLVLDVVVPIDGLDHGITPGSGIVASPALTPGSVVVDYEGGIYRRPGDMDYAEKVYIAAGRHVEVYPTVARQTLPAGDFIIIGSFDVATSQLDITEPQLLEEWQTSSEDLPDEAEG